MPGHVVKDLHHVYDPPPMWQTGLDLPPDQAAISKLEDQRRAMSVLKKRVLVTGGAGFLGSHLCERLLADGHEVLAVDNYFTGRRNNVAHLLDHNSFEIVRHDVTFPLYVEVDEIYNLACPASPIHYQFDPVQTTKVNVVGAINMLGLAKRVKAKVLQASTSEVYGDPTVHPQTEDYRGSVNPIGPRACYDEGKRCAETLFFDYYRQHKLRIKVVRIFNTYGPRMHPNDGRVVSNFIVQALQGEDITIFGNGAQTRAFCYVDDLVEEGRAGGRGDGVLYGGHRLRRHAGVGQRREPVVLGEGQELLAARQVWQAAGAHGGRVGTALRVERVDDHAVEVEHEQCVHRPQPYHRGRQTGSTRRRTRATGRRASLVAYRPATPVATRGMALALI